MQSWLFCPPCPEARPPPPPAATSADHTRLDALSTKDLLALWDEMTEAAVWRRRLAAVELADMKRMRAATKDDRATLH
eukprot:3626281-Prymnesium_polylepis.1